MAEDPHETFDPRFDPAFQRGYRPKAGEAMRVERRSAPEAKQPVHPPQAPQSPQRRVEPTTQSTQRRVEPTPAAADVAREGPANASVSLHPSEQHASDGHARDEYASDEQVNGEDWGGEDASGDAVVAATRSRNPYVVALWIIGIGAVVLGLALYVLSATNAITSTSSPGDQFQMMIFQLGWVFATPLVTIGLATIVGLLFLSASRHRTP